MQLVLCVDNSNKITVWALVICQALSSEPPYNSLSSLQWFSEAGVLTPFHRSGSWGPAEPGTWLQTCPPPSLVTFLLPCPMPASTGLQSLPFSCFTPKGPSAREVKVNFFFNISVLKQYYSLWATWTVASLRWSHKPWWIFTVSQWGWKGSWHGLRGLWKRVALGKSFM